MNISYRLQIAIIWLLYLPMVGVTYIVVWLDRRLQFPLPFPRNVAQLAQKKDWCIQKLKEGNALPVDAKIIHYKVTPLNQDLILRSNAGVIEIKYATGNGEKVLECFAKFAPVMGSVWNRTIFNLQLNHTKESLFNLEFVKNDSTIPAPEVYFSQISLLTANLCLLTEYMSDDVHYLECAYENFPAHHLELALEGMATLHARYWKSTLPRVKKVMAIEQSTVNFMDSIVSFTWSANARKILRQSWNYMNEFQTVLHGDSRVGNMMFPKSETTGRFVFIDWQAVRKGRAAYDLAYFLILSLKTEHRQSLEKQATETYYRYLISKGVTSYSKAEFEEDYLHACVCVLVLLSLPLLSGEASAEGEAADIFAFGMGVWRDRLKTKFNEFDYAWMADRYQLTEQQAKDAVSEMLAVISARLRKIELAKTT